MEQVEYHRMAAVEDSMWWFRALHAVVIQRLDQCDLLAGAAILDAGCGTGGLLARLARARPDFALVGLEFNPEAAALARKKTGRPICVGSVNGMPYAPEVFDAIVSADVLCHAGVDEGAALVEFLRCLKPGGWLLLNLPAYQWMASAHDRHVHNVRRYTAGAATRLLAGAGFGRIRAGYWNSLLFPLMLLHRLAAGRGEETSDVHAFPAWQDRAFFAITAVERDLARGGITLPFGGSVWISARKP